MKNFANRDAILVVDGQETLNCGRQTMPTFEPAHRFNCGPFGTMDVGLPLAVGREARQVRQTGDLLSWRRLVRPQRDGTRPAVRHKLPILVVISLNGGWTADPQRNKTGRGLGYTRYDKMAQGLGCYGEYVEQPEEIRPALAPAQNNVDEGMMALVNVKTITALRHGAILRLFDLSGAPKPKQKGGLKPPFFNNALQRFDAAQTILTKRARDGQRARNTPDH